VATFGFLFHRITKPLIECADSIAAAARLDLLAWVRFARVATAGPHAIIIRVFFDMVFF